MKENEATIRSGIGFYNAPSDSAMGETTSKDFLSSHCVNQELYQDIKNEIHKLYDRESSVWRRLFGQKRHPKLFTQVKVYDAHKVACITVGIVTPNFHGAWINIRRAGTIYVSITQDGLITDIVTVPKNMNPANGRHVHATKW